MNTETELRKVKCGQRELEYILTRKQVKNINLRIKPEGKLYVSANQRVPTDYIDNFIKSKQDFIIKALDKFEDRRKYTEEPKKYVNGECFNILGKRLPLKVEEGKEEAVTSDGESLFLTVKNKDNFKRKEKLVNDWLEALQIEIFNQICRETHQIFKKYGVEYPQVKIRLMKSRWGSCHTRKGIITLNSRLIEAPRSSIEYVVLHEFAHFIHPNHSKRFYHLVETLMPDWKERKKGLENLR